MLMKKTIFAAALCGLLLSACATQHQDHFKVAPDPTNVRTAIADGKRIIVNQEPIYFPRGLKNTRVTWNVPANSNYTFGRDGVVVEKGGDEIVDCKPSEDRKSFSCLNRHTKPGKYKYTIKFEGKPAIEPLDPTMDND
jgi:hypothetical protein